MAKVGLGVGDREEPPARGGRLRRLVQWAADHRELIRAILLAFGVKLPPGPLIPPK